MAAVQVWYCLGALGLGVASITLTLLIAREQHRRLALAYAWFLASLWLIVLSFAVTSFVHIARGGSAIATVGFVISATGSLAYVLIAPSFYHALLGIGRKRVVLIIYRVVHVATILLAGCLFIPTLRPAVAATLNLILFAIVLYGIILVGFGYRRIVERSLRRAILVFVALALVFFPFMFLESRPTVDNAVDAAGPFVLAALNGFALPTFFGLLSLLSIPFGLRRLNRPAFWAEGEPTAHFVVEHGLTNRESEILVKLCRGLSNREIGEALFISPKTVENHLSNIFAKTGVAGRMQLLTLLLSNQ